MPIMTPQILRSVDFTKLQKPRYLENKTSFSLQIKKIINYTFFKQFKTKESIGGVGGGGWEIGHIKYKCWP